MFLSVLSLVSSRITVSIKRMMVDRPWRLHSSEKIKSTHTHTLILNLHDLQARVRTLKIQKTDQSKFYTVHPENNSAAIVQNHCLHTQIVPNVHFAWQRAHFNDGLTKKIVRLRGQFAAQLWSQIIILIPVGVLIKEHWKIAVESDG